MYINICPVTRFILLGMYIITVCPVTNLERSWLKIHLFYLAVLSTELTQITQCDRIIRRNASFVEMHKCTDMVFEEDAHVQREHCSGCEYKDMARERDLGYGWDIKQFRLMNCKMMCELDTEQFHLMRCCGILIFVSELNSCAEMDTRSIFHDINCNLNCIYFLEQRCGKVMLNIAVGCIWLWS